MGHLRSVATERVRRPTGVATPRRNFGRGLVVQTAMRTTLIVFVPPRLDLFTRSVAVLEDLHVESLVTELDVEGLDVGVLPMLPGVV